MGVYFNLSFWYKLVDKTIWGAYFSGIGCVVLIAINVLFVPRYGYMACAWAGFAGYATAMILSYIVGATQISHRLSADEYWCVCGHNGSVLYGDELCQIPSFFPFPVALAVNTVLVLLFIGHIWKWD